MDRETLEMLFRDHILDIWHEKYHNLAKKENGEYWSYCVQEAWENWLWCAKTINDFHSGK